MRAVRWFQRGREPDPQAKAVEERTARLEERAETVQRRLREADPWTARVLDVIHRPHGEPHARKHA